MKKVFLIIYVKLLCLTTFCQKLNDTIYNNFRHCIERFFSDIQRKKSDTAIVFFIESPLIFEKSYHAGGINYSIKKNLLIDTLSRDTSTLKNKFVIEKEKSFDYFLNFLISTNENSKTTIANLKGCWAYVYMPLENWQQFYLDHLLGYDSLYVTPIIDIFDFHKKQVVHRRYQVECYYTRKTNFFIRKIILIIEKKILLPDVTVSEHFP